MASASLRETTCCSSPDMCNLYAVTTNREAMRLIAKAMNDSLGNFPELPGIYPDHVAPIVRLDAAGEREVVLARWGLPSSRTSRLRNPTGNDQRSSPRFDDWKGYLGVEP